MIDRRYNAPTTPYITVLGQRFTIVCFNCGAKHPVQVGRPCTTCGVKAASEQGYATADVQTDDDAAQSAAERADATARMLRDADLDAYTERMAEQEFGSDDHDDDFDPTLFVVTEATRPQHPGMTPAFFDLAVRRAFDAELSIQRTARASVVAVSSSVDADVSYLVTATTCGCLGHARHHRCMHRAMALWWWWVRSFDAPAVPMTAA